MSKNNNITDEEVVEYCIKKLNFAKDQVEFDQEFSKVLDELFQSKVNSKPSKYQSIPLFDA